MKTITILLTALFAFSGCTVKEYVYVEPKCPAIVALDPVPAVDINVSGGCVCYYFEQVGKYNEEFAK